MYIDGDITGGLSMECDTVWSYLTTTIPTLLELPSPTHEIKLLYVALFDSFCAELLISSFDAIISSDNPVSGATVMGVLKIDDELWMLTKRKSQLVYEAEVTIDQRF